MHASWGSHLGLNERGRQRHGAARPKKLTFISASRCVLTYVRRRAALRSSLKQRFLPLAQVAICVPIRDEASELPRLFEALDRLHSANGEPLQICLLLDGCVDGSCILAQDYRARAAHRVRIEDIGRSAANAGRARHRAMLAGLRAIGDDGLLMTTDADSCPSPDWVDMMTTALAQADVVTGRIIRAQTHSNPLQDRLEAYYDALFALRRALDPVPWEAPVTHHYSGGANMGVRGKAYRAIGGFPALASGEDARFVDAAGRAGFRVRRDAACIVRTSDRRHGRAIGGLAHGLRQLDGGDAQSIPVAHPDDAVWQYRMHATARLAHVDGRLDRIASELGLTIDHALGVARDCPNAEAFAMRIVPAPPAGMRAVPLPVAEAVLAHCPRGQEAA